MRLQNIAVAAAVALLLAACANQQPRAPLSPPQGQAQPRPADTARRSDFDKALDGWNGATVAELVKKLGKPDAVKRQPDGSSIYAFTKSMPDPQTGMARFSCKVRYVVDAKTQQVSGHQIEGC
ncbi:MAG TPA: hypothetical protein VGM81_04290 [Burkholderiaceae bacterium]|jgi:hypothetical protein